MTTPTQFDIEAEGAASQIEQKIDELLNELSFNGINDVSYCPGGHKLEKDAREDAKQAILQLITEARLDEVEKAHRGTLGDYGHSVQDQIYYRDRAEELRKEIK